MAEYPCVKLLIFDCDGVLVDSDRILLRIEAEELTKLGLPMTYEDCVREFLGIGMKSTVTRVEELLGKPIPPGWESKLETLSYRAFEDELEPVPGIVDALDALDRLALPTCVASSGTHHKMKLTLGLTGLYGRFVGRIFSVTEVERSKPAPDVFLHAARTLGARPQDCAVVEDSPAGVQAARAAGMQAFAYAAAIPKEWLAGEHTVVFDDMRQLPDLVAASRL
jgi:HAD superfamily hydrolase (TIGR01509 family)